MKTVIVWPYGYNGDGEKKTVIYVGVSNIHVQPGGALEVRQPGGNGAIFAPECWTRVEVQES